jgi:hypothetical protein
MSTAAQSRAKSRARSNSTTVPERLATERAEAALCPAAPLIRIHHERPRGEADRLRPGGAGVGTLLPYLDALWRDSVVDRGIEGRDNVSYAPNAPISARPDFRRVNARAAEPAQRSNDAGAGDRGCLLRQSTNAVDKLAVMPGRKGY